jgi:hypothetical protein
MPHSTREERLSIHSRIGTRVLDYSNVGIHTHYRIGLLLADAETRQRLAELRDAGHRTTLRIRIGEMMIALGAAIAGTTHDLHDRQATMPPPLRKPGFSPTR